MKREPKDKILDAAIGIFADKGFAAASIKDISSTAGTNIASINYHFSSKSELYRAVIERLIMEKPQPPVPSEDETAYEFTERFVRSFLHACSCTENPLMKILANEQVSSTGILKDTFYRHILPKHEMKVAFYRQKLGISERQANILIFSLIGATLQFIRGGEFISMMSPKLYSGGSLTEEGINDLAKEIASIHIKEGK